MTRAEIIERWRSRLADWKLVAAQVDGERIAEMVLADLDWLNHTDDDTLSLTEASAEGGYSTRQLSRLITSGQLENAGRENAPRVRRKDIPRKPRNTESSNTLLTLTRKAFKAKTETRGRKIGTN